MTRLVLCRHASPARPADADALVRALDDVPLAAIYTSPLARAVSTAVAIGEAHALVPSVVHDLREIDLGSLDGLRFEQWPPDLQATILAEPTRVRFPGGETFGEVQVRAVAALAAIVAAHANANVAVVTHAGTIRAALAAWLLADDSAAFRIDQRHCAINVVDWDDGVPFVRLLNGTPLPLPLAFDTGASRAAL
jgi:broad specificity phosphatase PhoE